MAAEASTAVSNGSQQQQRDLAADRPPVSDGDNLQSACCRVAGSLPAPGSESVALTSASAQIHVTSKCWSQLKTASDFSILF